mmetsp:Transcript_36282/g.78527  ORF Transcript_36282/g.78527 Transcript_36282/m.78527 type:complete len:84 (+) Transcript_36282:1154-1405(+)
MSTVGPSQQSGPNVVGADFFTDGEAAGVAMVAAGDWQGAPPKKTRQISLDLTQSLDCTTIRRYLLSRWQCQNGWQQAGSDSRS